MHDPPKSVHSQPKRIPLTDRPRHISPRPIPRLSGSPRVSKSPNLPSNGQESLVITGITVFPTEIISLKLLFTNVASVNYDEFIVRVRSNLSLQKLASLLPVSLTRSVSFEELLVKMFRGVTARELRILMRWVNSNSLFRFRKNRQKAGFRGEKTGF